MRDGHVPADHVVVLNRGYRDRLRCGPVPRRERQVLVRSRGPARLVHGNGSVAPRYAHLHATRGSHVEPHRVSGARPSLGNCERALAQHYRGRHQMNPVDDIFPTVVGTTVTHKDDGEPAVVDHGRGRGDVHVKREATRGLIREPRTPGGDTPYTRRPLYLRCRPRTGENFVAHES